jgi:hypothetical protein
MHLADGVGLTIIVFLIVVICSWPGLRQWYLRYRLRGRGLKVVVCFNQDSDERWLASGMRDLLEEFDLEMFDLSYDHYISSGRLGLGRLPGAVLLAVGHHSGFGLSHNSKSTINWHFYALPSERPINPANPVVESPAGRGCHELIDRSRRIIVRALYQALRERENNRPPILPEKLEPAVSHI